MRPRSRLAWLALAGLVPCLAAPALRAEEEPKPAAPVEEPAEKPEEPKVAPAWVTDVAAAKAQAAKEGKDLFIDFTGSDWCGWCTRLEAEVFHHAAFVDAASKKFVFVYLDFPRGEEAKAKVVDAELNQKLLTSYGVEGFPTIILTTADGAPYARTGYREGGPEAYVKDLDERHAKGQKVKALLQAKGKESVEALKAGFEVLGEESFLGYPDYAWILEDAEKKDADGKNGLKALVQKEKDRQAAAAEERAFQDLFQGVQRREDVPFDKVRAFVDGSKTLCGRALANGCGLVGEWLLEEKNDPKAAKAYFERALADEWVKGIPQAVEHFESLVKRCEEALSGAAEPAGEAPADGEGGEGK